MKMMSLVQSLGNDILLYNQYVTDVLAGIILGLICSKITIYFFNRVSQDTTVTM